MLFRSRLAISETTPAPAEMSVTDGTPGTVPHWLEIDDSAPTTWYVYPNTTDGQPLIATSQPGVGTGYDVDAGLEFDAAVDSVTRTLGMATTQQATIT